MASLSGASRKLACRARLDTRSMRSRASRHRAHTRKSLAGCSGYTACLPGLQAAHTQLPHLRQSVGSRPGWRMWVVGCVCAWRDGRAVWCVCGSYQRRKAAGSIIRTMPPVEKSKNSFTELAGRRVGVIGPAPRGAAHGGGLQARTASAPSLSSLSSSSLLLSFFFSFLLLFFSCKAHKKF